MCDSPRYRASCVQKNPIRPPSATFYGRNRKHSFVKACSRKGKDSKYCFPNMLSGHKPTGSHPMSVYVYQAKRTLMLFGEAGLGWWWNVFGWLLGFSWLKEPCIHSILSEISNSLLSLVMNWTRHVQNTLHVSPLWLPDPRVPRPLHTAESTCGHISAQP